MSLWLKFKLWIANKWGLQPLLKRPDIALRILLDRCDNRDLMDFGLLINRYMLRKVGANRWEKVAKVLVLRLQYLIRGIQHGIK